MRVLPCRPATICWLTLVAAAATTTATPGALPDDAASPLAAPGGPAAAAAPVTVTVDWTDAAGVGTSRTITTLQVVNNPILDRHFTVNGTTFANPIHSQVWGSLKNLSRVGLQMARFVPWYPYPRKAVAELFAPTPGQPLSWNFTLLLGQLTDFFEATADVDGADTVINFSTQPCWLFNANATQCKPPDNPDEADMTYGSISPGLLDPTGNDLAMYYARLIGYLKNGSMVDERGHTHRMPPGARTFNFTFWEVFNEFEHSFNMTEYIKIYDRLVSTVRKHADPDHNMKWMGLGGNDVHMIPSFLDPTAHSDQEIPLDFVSVHYYSGSGGVTGDDFAKDFFEGSDGFIEEMRRVIIPYRDASGAPSAGIDVDELGVLGDGSGCAPSPDYVYPEIYWNAAGAMYAYIFGQLVLDGVEALGQSQLMGSPALPKWGVPIDQFPGVSLLSWETGLGNAKYWTLKLLLEHFAPGDKLWKTTTAVAGLAHPRTAAEQTMCDEPGVWCGYKPFCGGSAGQSAAELGPVTLSCDAAGSTIAMVKFADFGTPTGACGTFKSNSSCSSAANTTALVSSLCIGKANCTISPAQLSAPTSCGSGAKLAFVVEAACTTQGGKATPAAIPALPPTPPGPPPPPNVFGSVVPAVAGSWCAEADLHGINAQNTWYLRCPRNETLHVVGAHYGDIVGTCAGHGLSTSLNCSVEGAATEYTRRQCGGKNGCVIETSWMAAIAAVHKQNMTGCPYLGERFIVEALCSGGSKGQATPCVPWKDFLYKTCIVDEPPPPAAWPYDSTPVPGTAFYSQAFTTKRHGRSVLLVNKVNKRVNVTLPPAPSGKGTLYLVDPISVGASSANGIRELQVVSSTSPGSGSTVELEPFAVGVFVLGGGSTE